MVQARPEMGRSVSKSADTNGASFFFGGGEVPSFEASSNGFTDCRSGGLHPSLLYQYPPHSLQVSFSSKKGQPWKLVGSKENDG